MLYYVGFQWQIHFSWSAFNFATHVVQKIVYLSQGIFSFLFLFQGALHEVPLSITLSYFEGFFFTPIELDASGYKKEPSLIPMWIVLFFSSFMYLFT